MDLVPVPVEPQPPERAASRALIPLSTTGLRRAGRELPPVWLILSSSTLIGLRVYLDEFARQLSQRKPTSTPARLANVADPGSADEHAAPHMRAGAPPRDAETGEANRLVRGEYHRSTGATAIPSDLATCVLPSFFQRVVQVRPSRRVFW